MIYDISRKLTQTTAVWPGDTAFSIQHNLMISQGSSVNLTTITLSPHTGAHADAYFHYADDGLFAADMPLDAYLGPAKVVSVSRRDGPLLPEDFMSHDLSDVQRLLIHSHVSELADDQWPGEFPYLSVELIAWLANKGCRLIGLDSPSVDAFDSQDLPCHHALLEHKLVNLELLQLRDVPDGDYELIALPLKLDGVCASPVRAVLRSP